MSVWTDDEILVITELYTKLGPEGVAPLLPNRSIYAIKTKASDLRAFYVRPWTTAEEKILKTNYPNLGAEGCVPLLPGRTKTGIYRAARRMKIKHERYWTEQENAILRQYYATEGVKGCARRLPGRGQDAIQAHATNGLGLEAGVGTYHHFGCGDKNRKTKVPDKIVALVRVKHNEIWPGKTTKEKAAELGISARHFRSIVTGKKRKYAVLEAA